MNRLFTGIAVDAAQMPLLAECADSLRAAHPDFRWSERAGWHVTLQFYGMVDEAREQQLRERLRLVKTNPVNVAVQGIGIFERAGVLFAGVVLSEPLQALQRSVVEAGAACGFAAEDRPYRPHITLARRKGRSGPWNFQNNVGVDAQRAFGQFVASEFALYESVAGPGGSRYEVLERYAL